MNKLRIAQISPLYESVPPRAYGGTERVVHFLTEELVRQGHEVTLFASGDSRTSARLVAGSRASLREDPECQDSIAHHVLLVEKVMSKAREFDVIHNHIEYFPYSCLRRAHVPHLTTLHGRLDLPDLGPLYEEFHDVPLVSISDSQRTPLPRANWIGTVHHGLDPDLFRLEEHPGDYLVFVGRVSEEKRVDTAIEIASLLGMRLIIAAKIGESDRKYHEQVIRPLIEGNPLVEFIGEIDDARKQEIIGGALAMVFPIDWPEPFGLAMIEAMACGTPVIARRRGSIPEVVDDGVTGFVFEDPRELAALDGRLSSLDRRGVRAVFERRFSASRMAEDYLRLYESVIASTLSIDGRAEEEWQRSSESRTTTTSSQRPHWPTVGPASSRTATRSPSSTAPATSGHSGAASWASTTAAPDT